MVERIRELEIKLCFRESDVENAIYREGLAKQRIKELEELNRLKTIDIELLEQRNDRLNEMLEGDARRIKDLEDRINCKPAMGKSSGLRGEP